jgi:hypothetical protein
MPMGQPKPDRAGKAGRGGGDAFGIDPGHQRVDRQPFFLGRCAQHPRTRARG